MKLLSFILFNIVHSTKTKIITNNYPSCKNCIYHKPAFSDNYASLFSKCTKFGNKNIITCEITNNYADFVRNDKKLINDFINNINLLYNHYFSYIIKYKNYLKLNFYLK